jgi:hypothetical protein
VRFAHSDELPGASRTEALERISRAKITTGYCVKDKLSGSFSSYVEANVHADQVWQVVRELARAILPTVAAPIVGVKEDEPILGPYTTRTGALQVFEPFIDGLQNDGFLEFGMIFQQGGRTEEVFVASVKYLKVWTSQLAAVRAVLEGYSIPEVPALEFLDEYPRVSESLRPDGNARWPLVTEALQAAFETLPLPGELQWNA